MEHGYWIISRETKSERKSSHREGRRIARFSFQWTPGMSLLRIKKKKEIWSLLQDCNVCGFTTPEMRQRDSCCLLTDTNALSLSHTYTNTHTHVHAHTHTYARSESYWHQLKMARIKNDFLSTVNNDKYLIFMEPSYFSSCHLLLLRCFVCAGETVLILFTVHSWTDKWPHISY